MCGTGTYARVLHFSTLVKSRSSFLHPRNPFPCVQGKGSHFDKDSPCSLLWIPSLSSAKVKKMECCVSRWQWSVEQGYEKKGQGGWVNIAPVET